MQVLGSSVTYTCDRIFPFNGRNQPEDCVKHGRFWINGDKQTLWHWIYLASYHQIIQVKVRKSRLIQKYGIRKIPCCVRDADPQFCTNTNKKGLTLTR